MKPKIFTLIASLLLSVMVRSQTMATEPEMADTLRSNGKIYVVISVLAITFICIIGYLIYIDIKLKKLEDKK